MAFEIPRRLDNSDPVLGAEPSAPVKLASRDRNEGRTVGANPATGATLEDRLARLLSDLIKNHPHLCGSGVPLHGQSSMAMVRKLLAEIERP
jgi:hypothetical protein